MTEPRPSKRERTRRKLLEAGMQVIAERGEAFTASDVVTAADVSNGTFYNHFVDRDAFVKALASESLKALTARSADDTKGADPAWRFAVASTRVLDTGARDPVWGRAVLRLNESPTPLHVAVQRHLRADLAEGHRTGRFAYGDDPVTIDLVSGTLIAALRRLISETTDPGFVPEVVARLLEAIGVDAPEARTLTVAAHEAERSHAIDATVAAEQISAHSAPASAV